LGTDGELLDRRRLVKGAIRDRHSREVHPERDTSGVVSVGDQSEPALLGRKRGGDTRSLPMQERNLREIRRRPAIIVRDTVPVLVRVDPALRYELLPVFAPEERAPIDRPFTKRRLSRSSPSVPNGSNHNPRISPQHRHSREVEILVGYRAIA
jgi:hypothetical protein